MDWGVFWGAVGALVGVVGLVGVAVAVMTYRKQHPKRLLRYTVDAEPVLTDFAAKVMLRVEIAGQRLHEPHIVHIRVRSDSRADIPSTAFDAGRAIAFTLSKDAYVMGASLEQDGPIGFSWHATAGAVQRLEIPPQLIRRGNDGIVTLVAEGPLEVKEHNSLIDIDLTAQVPRDSSRAQSVLVLAFLLAISGTSALGGAVVALWGYAQGVAMR